MQPASSTGPEQVLQDLELAARNHALPLEALRYPVTPVGLHYVLTHYDIPSVDPGRWRLQVGGRVRRELTLSLDEIRSLPLVRARVTMECAGNGRALLEPRTPGQPWLQEAVGTAEWGGTPLRLVLEQAGIPTGAREVVFTGLDRGVEDGVEQTFERSLSLEDAVREEVLLAYEMNGQPLPPQHGGRSPWWNGRSTATSSDGPTDSGSWRTRRESPSGGCCRAR
jgi:sulfane dehydrogenase subunit SoxC